MCRKLQLTNVNVEIGSIFHEEVVTVFASISHRRYSDFRPGHVK